MIEPVQLAGSWFDLAGSALALLVGYLGQRYLLPFLSVGKRQRYAQYIAQIADELTDELMLKYPDRQWLAHLDEVIDMLCDICGITPEIAKRALNASAARK